MSGQIDWGRPVQRIVSKDNPTFKALRALGNELAEIRAQRSAVLAGAHLIQSCLQSGHTLRQVLLAPSAAGNAEVGGLLAALSNVPALELAEALFKEVVQLVTPTGIAAVIDLPAIADDQPVGDAVLLDAIQDAGNVGTLLRTAAAAGFNDVILGNGCAGAWTAKVLRAAQGAHFSLRIREQVDLPVWIRHCQQPVLGAVAAEGTSLYQISLLEPHIWVFGNEGAGISPAVETTLRQRVTISMAEGSESLNVSAAAAVCLFEARRQRLAV
jgi:TrmH family RNA methyltransferase